METGDLKILATLFATYIYIALESKGGGLSLSINKKRLERSS